MNKRIRMITEGAMMVAIIGAFLMIDRQLANMLEAFLFWGFPLPILIFTVKYGLRDGIVCSVCAILVSFIVATPQSVFLVICSALIGVVYGYGVHQQKNNWWLLISTFIISFLYYVVTMYLFASFFGYDMIKETEEIYTLVSSLFNNGTMVSSANVFVKVLFPILLVLTPLLQTIVVHLTAVMLLKRLKIAEVKTKPLATITMPKWLSWILVGCYLVLSLVLQFVDISVYPETVEVVLQLARFSIMIIFMFFGVIALVIFGAVTKNRWISMIALVGCLLLPSAVMVLGMLDTGTDFRRDFIRRYYHAG